MKIWVDADACPQVIKDILFKAANRTKTPLILVSNQVLRRPPSLYITTIQVSQGLDEADNRIVKEMTSEDLVITADIPLAAFVIEKGGTALNPRGELYTLSNIKQKLAMRNFNEEMRGAGLIMGGPAKLNPQHNQAFANQLDKWLTQNKR